MSILEYLYYLILYIYVAFGFVYFLSKIFRLGIKFGEAPQLDNIGFTNSSLDFPSKISLENIFQEIGINSIENE